MPSPSRAAHGDGADAASDARATAPAPGGPQQPQQPLPPQTQRASRTSANAALTLPLSPSAAPGIAADLLHAAVDAITHQHQQHQQRPEVGRAAAIMDTTAPADRAEGGGDTAPDARDRAAATTGPAVRARRRASIEAMAALWMQHSGSLRAGRASQAGAPPATQAATAVAAGLHEGPAASRGIESSGQGPPSGARDRAARLARALELWL